MAIIYIGLAQCLFAALLVFSKRPMSTANKILGVWLLSTSILYLYLLLKNILGYQNDLWQLLLSLNFTFPEFLVLYTKYITTDSKRFRKRDILFFMPSFITLFSIGIYYSFHPGEFFSYELGAGIPIRLLTPLYYLTLFVYTILSIYYVFHYKKQINNYYSFDSRKINLSWLMVVIVAYFVSYFLLFIGTAYFFRRLWIEQIRILSDGVQLIFIYILSYFGFLQQQLSGENPPIALRRLVFKESNPETYKKSSLKEQEKVEDYLKRLVDCMNKLEPWKDNELSVAKLSELTDIPRHHITQILNDNLKKNFYTFVNEFRTEYAKSIITSPKYSHWSIMSIAFESGFNSKAAFNGFFKKYTGMTPSEYKDHHVHHSKKAQ